MSPCRGRRTHHVQKECTGSWEILRLARDNARLWPASGKRGAVADDVRTQEVGPRSSSYEVGEQCGAIRCGAGGAKDGDQGECGPAKHTPGTGLGKCVTSAGPHTTGCKAKEEGTVHLASPPRQRRPAQAVVLRTQEGRGTWGRRPGMARLRDKPRGQPRGLARSGPSGSVSGTAQSATIHTKSRWTAGRSPWC